MRRWFNILFSHVSSEASVLSCRFWILKFSFLVGLGLSLGCRYGSLHVFPAFMWDAGHLDEGILHSPGLLTEGYGVGFPPDSGQSCSMVVGRVSGCLCRNDSERKCVSIQGRRWHLLEADGSRWAGVILGVKEVSHTWLCQKLLESACLGSWACILVI